MHSKQMIKISIRDIYELPYTKEEIQTLHHCLNLIVIDVYLLSVVTHFCSESITLGKALLTLASFRPE